MRTFFDKGGSSGRMAPPPVPPLQPSYHLPRSPLRSSGICHQPQPQPQPPQPEYPAVSASSLMDVRYAKRQNVDGGPSPSELSLAQQQQQIAGYPTQQYQGRNQAHWYGSCAQSTNALLSQPSQPTYGYSSTSAGPVYSHHAHCAHAPTRTAPTYAAPIPIAPSQWTCRGGTQGQEQYYYTGGAAYSHPMQAYQLSPYALPTHATGTYQPPGSASSGPRPIVRPTPPMISGPIPPSAVVPLVSRPRSSSGESKSAAAGPSAAVSTVSTQVPRDDSSNQGQEYSLGPVSHPQLVQTQPYSQQPYTYTSATYATPTEVVPLVNEPSSHISTQSPQPNLTASGVDPNSGAGPSSSNINISGASTIGEPTSSNQQSRRERTQEAKPFKRPAPTSRTRPTTYQGDLRQLQQRCRSQGADDGAIRILGKIFADKVSLEALKRPLTDAEAETKEFGIKAGMVYTALLKHPDEENDGYTCRLCHSGQTWKHHRDVLRHLRRDHFGISDDCDQWYVSIHPLMVASVDILLGM